MLRPRALEHKLGVLWCAFGSVCASGCVCGLLLERCATGRVSVQASDPRQVVMEAVFDAAVVDCIKAHRLVLSMVSADSWQNFSVEVKMRAENRVFYFLPEISGRTYFLPGISLQNPDSSQKCRKGRGRNTFVRHGPA